MHQAPAAPAGAQQRWRNPSLQWRHQQTEQLQQPASSINTADVSAPQRMPLPCTPTQAFFFANQLAQRHMIRRA
jgi:hypothetical protein